MGKILSVRFLLVCIFWLWAINGASQNFSIEVIDSIGNPIHRVSITVSDSSTRKIITYGFTNKEGLFFQDLGSLYKGVILNFRHLSFEEQSIYLPSIHNEKLMVTLKPKITTLKEVIVKSDIPIKFNGDTTIFNVGKYIQPEDRKLSDLFKNMPGFNVQSNGLLTYNGKFVERLFIEGDDPGGSNYGLITQNMSLNGIDKVEVVDNYDDNRLLKNVRRSDKVAVNIQMKEEYKMRLSGSGSLGLSLGKQHSGSASSTLLKKKVKQLIFLTTNNTGESLGENYDGTVYKSNEDLVAEMSTNENVNIVSAGGLTVPGIDNRLTLQNNDHGAASLLSWRVGKTIKMNGQFGLRELNKDVHKKESTLFNLSGFDRWERISDEKQSETNNLFFSTISFKQDNGGNSVADGSLIIKKEIGKLSYINSLTGTFSDSMSEHLANNIWKYDFNWTKSILLRKKVFRVGIFSSLNDGEQSLYTNTNRLYKFFKLDSSFVQFCQRSNKQIHTNSIELSINEKKGKSYLEYGFHFSDIRTSAAFNQYSIKHFEQLLETDRLKTNHTAAVFYGKRSFIIAPKSSLSFKTVLGIGNFRLGYKEYYLPDIKTVVSFRKIFSKKASLTISHTFDKSFSDWDNLVPNNLLNGNASLQRNLIFTGVSTSNKISSSFSSNNIIVQRFFLFQTSYTLCKNQYGMSTWQYPEYSISSYERFRNSRVFSILSSQRVYLNAIKTSVNIGFNWRAVSRDISLNGSILQQSNKLGHFTLELKTGFHFPVNLSVTGLVNYSAFKWGNGSSISNYQYGFYSKISWKLSKKIFMAGRWRWDELAPRKGFHSIDYFFTWKLNKYLDFKCEAVNLLNASVVSYRTLNAYTEQNSFYRITNRFVLITGSFSF